MATKFWGLVAENGRGYLQKVERGFSITMATLEPIGFGTPNSRYDEKPVHVVVKYADTDYILCTLWHKEHIIQTPLNIPFAAGEVLEVHIQGGTAKTKVHLTGFYTDSVPTPNSPERQSILVSSDSKSKNKAKKRVSIQEEVNIKRFENDDEDIDDDDDDDEDYDEEDDDMDDEGLIAMLNGKLAGDMEDDEDDDFELDDDDSDDEDQASPENKNGGGKTDMEKKSKSLNKNASITLSDEDDDDDDDSDDEEEDEEEQPVEVTMTSPIKNKKLESLKTPEGNKKNKDKEMKTPENQGIVAKNPSSAGHTPMKFVSKGGIMVHELKIGSGSQAKQGKMLAVYYSGRLKSNNKQFDATTSGPGFKFRLGKGEVIKGWDVGVDGMKVGGKRRIIIPSHMAYGKKGAPPDIPPNATLVFEIELKNVS